MCASLTFTFFLYHCVTAQPSAFMSDENKHHVANYARFAFCKKDETLNAAVAKLARLADFRKKPAEL